MTDFKTENFKYGTVNEIEGESAPDGSASDSLNWITKGDLIELRRGSKILGTLQGTGQITGAHVGQKADGTEILFITHGRKVLYYDTTTFDFVEIGTNILASAADGEDISFASYHSLAGAQVFLNSPNNGLFKIMTANPGSYTDLTDATKNYKGYIKIKQNRMWLWNRNEDKTGVYLSYIDAANYTTVSAENIGTGDGSTKTFADTLTFKAAGATRTCFAIEVTDGTETFTDNYDGTLTGSLGGTGTINYTTGAISVTFNTAPLDTQAITCDYQWEDSNDGGLGDFTYTNPTRVAGEGDVFRQDDGGAIQSILSYDDVEYCIHEKKTWAITLTADDTNATNLIYRELVGIPNWRCAVATADGIYYIDTSISTKPRFRLLQYQAGSSKVIPRDVTLKYNFENYRFDLGVMEEWDDYIVIHCRHKDSATNNTTFLYNKLWDSIDRLDYFANCAIIYGGAYHLGDSITNNLWEAFSGFDDDDAGITNYWEGNITDLGITNLKKERRFRIRGLISKTMKMKVYLNPDNSGFTQIGEVDGSATYVDIGTPIYIGAKTIGSSEIGGGSDGAFAYRYVTEFTANIGKFKDVQVKFEADAQQIGYVAVSSINHVRLKLYANKLPEKYD